MATGTCRLLRLVASVLVAVLVTPSGARAQTAVDTVLPLVRPEVTPALAAATIGKAVFDLDPAVAAAALAGIAELGDPRLALPALGWVLCMGPAERRRIAIGVLERVLFPTPGSGALREPDRAQQATPRHPQHDSL